MSYYVQLQVKVHDVSDSPVGHNYLHSGQVQAILRGQSFHLRHLRHQVAVLHHVAVLQRGAIKYPKAAVSAATRSTATIPSALQEGWTRNETHKFTGARESGAAVGRTTWMNEWDLINKRQGGGRAGTKLGMVCRYTEVWTRCGSSGALWRALRVAGLIVEKLSRCTVWDFEGKKSGKCNSELRGTVEHWCNEFYQNICNNYPHYRSLVTF